MTADPPPVPALTIDDAWWPRPSRGPFRHTVGTRGADPATWLRPRAGDDVLLRWKANLLATEGARAFGALPGTEAAGAAVLALVRAAQATDEAGTDTAHPLLTAAGLVVEDLCVLDMAGPEPVLVAGAVTMPSRWLLGEKVGRTMLGVHGPVPGYADEIGSATDRLLAKLAGDRIMARVNWTLTDRPELFQPADASRVERPSDRTPASLYVRAEYQTVRALPGGGVLFTIRTAREPLADAAHHPDRAATLLAAIESMTDEHLDYKGVLPYRALVTAYLRERAAASRPAPR